GPAMDHSRPDRRREMAGGNPLALDSAAWHSVSPEPGWTEPAADRVDLCPGAGGRRRLVAGDRGTGGFVPPEPAVDPGRGRGGFSGLRPVPVFLLLGADAGPHVADHRAVGT